MNRRKNVIVFWWIVSCSTICFQSINAQQEGAEILKVEQYRLFEAVMINSRQYADPLRDVKLVVKLVNPEGKSRKPENTVQEFSCRRPFFCQQLGRSIEP